MKLGLIARMDKTGLGQGQTLRLARMLKPDYIMLIDSTSFNENEQHPEWYAKDFGCYYVNGFPSSEQIVEFLNHVDVVISCETFYNNSFTTLASRMNKKTILIANYEFFDWHKQDYFGVPTPSKIVMPSVWHYTEMKQRYNAVMIPTPIFEDEFAEAYKVNLARESFKPKLLFMNGRDAVHDRNGLTTLYDSLKYLKEDVDIVIKAQNDVVRINDSRITYDFSNTDIQEDLYKDFDALILPRRYAGQCLPMNEALLCGLPVFMPNCSPNDYYLPKDWLIKCLHTGSFMTRTKIDMYSADAKHLAEMIDNFEPSVESKKRARSIGEQFLADNLTEQYKELINDFSINAYI